jgi:hypothetical protein
MAFRGNKPKPTELHVLENTTNVTRAKKRIGEPISPGGPVAPNNLSDAESALWNQFVVTAFWLHLHDSSKAFMWVSMQAEFEENPREMLSARIGQLRILGSELGLDPGSRSRMGATNPTVKDPYFDD